MTDANKQLICPLIASGNGAVQSKLAMKLLLPFWHYYTKQACIVVRVKKIVSRLELTAEPEIVSDLIHTTFTYIPRLICKAY